MSSQTVFAVSKSSYDGDAGFYIPEIIAVSFDKTVCEKYIKDAEKSEERILKARELLFDWQDSFYKDNPKKLDEYLLAPKWPVGLTESQITVEMRKERDNIKKHNELVLEKNREASDIYDRKLFENKCIFLKSLDLLPEEIDILLHSNYNSVKSKFSIVNIPFLS